jgi:hypothetical protein
MSDFALGTTIYLTFTTRSFTTGAPQGLAGSPALSVLEENNATPITAGVSVSVNRAGVTGLNEATIVATSGNGYEEGKQYSLYISAGTVGGVSVVGEVVGHFSIEKESALRPTTALPGAFVAGTAGHIIGTNLNATVSSRSTYAGADTAGTTTLLSRLTALRAGYLDNLSGGAVPTANENADALLLRNVAGGSSSGRTVREALYFIRNKWTATGGTLTVYAIDDSTISWTSALTQTPGNPVSESDPT